MSDEIGTDELGPRPQVQVTLVHLKLPHQLVDGLELVAKENLTTLQTVVRIALADYLAVRGKLERCQ